MSESEIVNTVEPEPAPVVSLRENDPPPPLLREDPPPAWRTHPEGPFAGIVAVFEAEIARLEARLAALEGGTVAKPTGPDKPASTAAQKGKE